MAIKLKWHTEKRKVSSLKFYEKNPRIMPDKNMHELMHGIDKVDLVEIPAIDLDDVLIAGNQRVRALLLLGRSEEEIDVRVPNRKLSKSEFKFYLLASNRISGFWDFDALKADFDIETLMESGFDSNDLSNIFDDSLTVEDDDFPIEQELEKARKTDIKLGDMFLLGNHKLLCADSTKTDTIKRLVGNTKVNVINTDIPYNLKIPNLYNSGIGGKKNYGGKTNDSKTDEQYLQFVKSLISNGLSTCHKDCHIFFWHDEKYTGMMQELYRESGISQKRLCFWIKGNQNPTPKIAFNKTTELCLYGTRGNPFISDKIKNLNEVLNKEMTTGNRLIEDILDMLDIWLVKRIASNLYTHPTEKPVTLYEKPLRRCSKPGDIILDMTAGSGSLMIAAEQLKRVAYLVEIEPVFTQLIINRYEKHTNKKAIRIN
jgi:DNA modification methylase